MTLRKDGAKASGSTGPLDGGADALREYRQALGKANRRPCRPADGPAAGSGQVDGGPCGPEPGAGRAAEAPARPKDWQPSKTDVDAYLETVGASDGADIQPAGPTPVAADSAGGAQDPTMAASRASHLSRESPGTPEAGPGRSAAPRTPEQEDPLAKARAWLEGSDLDDETPPAEVRQSPAPPSSATGGSATAAQAGGQGLDAYQKAKQKLHATQSAQQSAKAAVKAEKDASFRASVGKLRNRPTRAAPQAERPQAVQSPAGSRNPKQRPTRQGPAPTPTGSIPAWQIKAGTGVALLLTGLLTQWQVYQHLNAAYTPGDLAIGLVALLAAGPVLIWIHPKSRAEWIAVISGAAVIAVAGCAGFAFGQWFSGTAPLRNASLVIELIVQLGLFTFLLGPLFLALVWLLDRMGLMPQSDL